MFSSPLPYKRPDSERYDRPLPPPVPASPLRRHEETSWDPQPPTTTWNSTTVTWDSECAEMGMPGMHHTASAPAIIPSHPVPTSNDQGTEERDLTEAIRRSLTFDSSSSSAYRATASGKGKGNEGPWRDLEELQEGMDLCRAARESEETEAERMVRVMSRRGKRNSVPRDSGYQGQGYRSDQPQPPPNLEHQWDHGYQWDQSYSQTPGFDQTRGYQQTPGFEAPQGYQQGQGYQQTQSYQQDQEYQQPQSYQPDQKYQINQEPYPNPRKYSSPAPPPRPQDPNEYPSWPQAASAPTFHQPDPQFPRSLSNPSLKSHQPPVSHPKYIPTLPQLDSAEVSGTTTPLPAYAHTPETSYLDAVPFERFPGGRGIGEGGAVRMPAAEDYASIPGYGAYDSDDSDLEPETVPEADRVGEGALERRETVQSRRSYTVGDEAGLTRVSEAVPEVEERTSEARTEETGKVEGVIQEKRTLVFSYHPLPTAAEPSPVIPAKSTLPPQIKLYLLPISFQLLSTSLKRLLADLMISADSLFVPCPSAYAESDEEHPQWGAEVWVRTFALPVAPNRRVVGGGFRTMVGIELDEVKRPVAGRTSSSSLSLTRTRSSVGEREVVPSAPRKPAATTSDHENALVPTFATSYVLRLRLTQPLHVPFTAAQLVETLHRHYKYGQRIARSATTSVAPGTVEENAYSFAKMVDRAPGPVDEVARLSKAHKLGKTTGGAVVQVEDRDDIQGQAGRKGFRYTVRKAVSKAVGVVQSEREETVEDDRANWVTPFTG